MNYALQREEYITSARISQSAFKISNRHVGSNALYRDISSLQKK